LAGALRRLGQEEADAGAAAGFAVDAHAQAGARYVARHVGAEEALADPPRMSIAWRISGRPPK